MKEFKKAAYDILKDAGKPLHSRDIVERAKRKRILSTVGKTPAATMNALLIVDINEKKGKSLFKKVGPSTFTLNVHVKNIKSKLDEEEKYRVSRNVSSKQKGDIAEARIAELVMLYGEGLSCYRPISDDEGIDLVVKKRNDSKTFFLQVKSRYGTSRNTSMIAQVKKSNVRANKSMGLVFCFFDVDEGDIWRYLWFVPASNFVRIAQTSRNKKLGDIYRFVAGKSKKLTNKWDKFLIEKQKLGKKIAGYLEG